MEKPRISAVIQTLNEEKNIAFAVQSVCRWADEVIVVDMYSEDQTVEIARRLGARVVFHERTGYVEPARAFAVAQATGTWVLLLDADEMIPLRLSEQLREIALKDEADVVLIPKLNYLLGAPLKYTSWGPGQLLHMNFFKPGSVRFQDCIHGSISYLPSARISKLTYDGKNAIVHFNYLDAAHFLQKLNQYTTIEARQALERGEQFSPFRALAGAAKIFAQQYFHWGGRREGWRGFYLSCFMALYHLSKCAKLQELKSGSSVEAVAEFYRGEAERVLKEYEEVPSHHDLHVVEQIH